MTKAKRDLRNTFYDVSPEHVTSSPPSACSLMPTILEIPKSVDFDIPLVWYITQARLHDIVQICSVSLPVETQHPPDCDAIL